MSTPVCCTYDRGVILEVSTVLRNIICELLNSVVKVTGFPKPEQIRQTIEAATQLYDNNRGIAFFSVQNMKKFIGLFGIEQEDFDQVCLSGLWAAALTFNPEKARFSTWAYMVVRHWVIRELNRNYIRPGRIQQYITFKTSEGKEIVLGDIVDYRRLDLFDKLEANEILHKMHTELKPRTADILVERLVWDLTLEECGVKRAITRERIRQIETQGLQMLKASFKPCKAKLIH